MSSLLPWGWSAGIWIGAAYFAAAAGFAAIRWRKRRRDAVLAFGAALALLGITFLAADYAYYRFHSGTLESPSRIEYLKSVKGRVLFRIATTNPLRRDEALSFTAGVLSEDHDAAAVATIVEATHATEGCFAAAEQFFIRMRYDDTTEYLDRCEPGPQREAVFARVEIARGQFRSASDRIADMGHDAFIGFVTGSDLTPSQDRELIGIHIRAKNWGAVAWHVDHLSPDWRTPGLACIGAMAAGRNNADSAVPTRLRELAPEAEACRTLLTDMRPYASRLASTDHSELAEVLRIEQVGSVVRQHDIDPLPMIDKLLARRTVGGDPLSARRHLALLHDVRDNSGRKWLGGSLVESGLDRAATYAVMGRYEFARTRLLGVEVGMFDDEGWEDDARVAVAVMRYVIDLRDRSTPEPAPPSQIGELDWVLDAIEDARFPGHDDRDAVRWRWRPEFSFSVSPSVFAMASYRAGLAAEEHEHFELAAEHRGIVERHILAEEDDEAAPLLAALRSS